ncbi:unnamed protein product [Microthlaspi erraticum]|uniref:DUF4216 domain-containing protein n=1 Tax=Microthlaspi erraticum TaxID=1685480 RepID=A0A6D2I5P0_9BRAS|nr:unnamed protein product [Microthlaspi erraticum]
MQDRKHVWLRGYLAGECIAFCMEFLRKSVPVQEPVNRNEDVHADGNVLEGRPLQKATNVTLSDRDKDIAHQYILMNLAIMDPYVDWANRGYRLKEEDGFTLVNLHMNQSPYMRDPYILPSQAKQVFYSRENDSSSWYVVMRAPPRGYHELETEEEFVGAPLSVQEVDDLGNQSSDDESFYVRDDYEGVIVPD